jgi:membrane-bound lytic murein transglycosylase A
MVLPLNWIKRQWWLGMPSWAVTGMATLLMGLMPAVASSATLAEVAADLSAPTEAESDCSQPVFPEAELPIPPPLRLVDPETQAQLWQSFPLPADRQPLLQAIQYSLDYLSTDKAAEDYQDFPVEEITRDRVRRTLQRLYYLVRLSPNDQVFQSALAEDFVLYESVGSDNQGSVTFTGYFEPYYQASPVPTEEYRYPLYRRPADLDDWPLPHPTRLDLEGQDGLQGAQGPLAGLELVWLADRLEAFLVQVQGSAKLEFPDGRVISVGYAGRTDYPYTSIGRALVEAGEIAEDELSLPNLLGYFEAHPEALDVYLPLNQRFIFFRETDGGAPTGSLSVPVTAGYSIATDKSLLPPGAAALIQLPLPQLIAQDQWINSPTSRLVLDQDTGGAIIGPGRVDLFVGSGSTAGDLAGRINTQGRLLYLLLKD